MTRHRQRSIRDNDLNKLVKVRITEGEHEGEVVRCTRKGVYRGNLDNRIGTVYIPTDDTYDLNRIPEDMAEEV